jgi:hypothetical protein
MTLHHIYTGEVSDASALNADLFATVLGTLPLFETLKIHVPNSFGDTFLIALGHQCQTLMCSSMDRMAGLRCWQKEADGLRKNSMRPRTILENLQKESRCSSTLRPASLPTRYARLALSRLLEPGIRSPTPQMTPYLTSEDESWRRAIRNTVGWCAPGLDRERNPDAPDDTARRRYRTDHNKTN